jgi:hypothetical protein
MRRYLPYLKAVSSIRNLRTRHAVVKRYPLDMAPISNTIANCCWVVNAPGLLIGFDSRPHTSNKNGDDNCNNEFGYNYLFIYKLTQEPKGDYKISVAEMETTTYIQIQTKHCNWCHLDDNKNSARRIPPAIMVPYIYISVRANNISRKSASIRGTIST